MCGDKECKGEGERELSRLAEGAGGLREPENCEVWCGLPCPALQALCF